jgi:dolichol-phosphate mannosyltransferase
LGALQIALALRIASRLFRTLGGQKIQLSTAPVRERVTVLLPVLNEGARISECLESLIAQPAEVSEILVVDGGSIDGTQAIVERYRSRDPRLRLINATPVNSKWTGKAWGLYIGLRNASTACEWILCVDADARFAPELARSVLNHAKVTGVSNFSIATKQQLTGPGEGLLHPALLTTLVYRFGSPGAAANDPHYVQANGQCFLSRRDTLTRTAAVEAAQHSLCEDITIARRLADCGETVGFYEAGELAEVSMYTTWREAWENWPRSLPMRDQYFGWREAVGLIEVVLVQAVPTALVVLGAFLPVAKPLLMLNGFLFLARLGVLIGTARAYAYRPWTYWLSPLLDLPVAVGVVASAFKRRHIWRNRVYVRRRLGGYELDVSPQMSSKR